MQLPAGVHTFPISATVVGRESTIYPSAIETDNGLLLVDVGFRDSVDDVLDGVTDAGFSIDDIRYVLLTHQDMDHAAGLSKLREETDCLVMAHRRDSPMIDGREDPRAVPPSGRYPPTRVDIELEDGVTINTHAGPVQVIETPGHTPGHVSLYLSDAQLLIAGDAVIVAGNHLAPPRSDFTMDTETASRSIATLAEHDIEHALCFHGGYIEEGADRLKALVASD